MIALSLKNSTMRHMNLVADISAVAKERAKLDIEKILYPAKPRWLGYVRLRRTVHISRTGRNDTFSATYNRKVPAHRRFLNLRATRDAGIKEA